MQNPLISTHFVQVFHNLRTPLPHPSAQFNEIHTILKCFILEPWGEKVRILAFICKNFIIIICFEMKNSPEKEKHIKHTAVFNVLLTSYFCCPLKNNVSSVFNWRLGSEHYNGVLTDLSIMHKL